MRYRGVLLDVDGTLVASNDAHAHAWAEAFADAGHDVPYARVRSLIGMGGEHLIEEVVGIPRDTRAHRKLSEHRSKLFRDRWLEKVTPLRGSRELVLRLRSAGYLLVIASSAKDEELAPLLEIAGVADLDLPRATSSDVEHSKPDPDILEAALRRLPVERSRAVLVGDTPFDVRAGRDASLDVIAVTTGGFSIEQLAGAVAVFDGPAGILARWEASPFSGPF
jgi:HAD superfamily hydrolase (TIGR01509 family)